jgi:hypothetical protein
MMKKKKRKSVCARRGQGGRWVVKVIAAGETKD